MIIIKADNNKKHNTNQTEDRRCVKILLSGLSIR